MCDAPFFLQLNSCNKGGNKRDSSAYMPTVQKDFLSDVAHDGLLQDEKDNINELICLIELKK